MSKHTWQTMATAPKDGSYFIAWDAGARLMLFTAHWFKEEREWGTEYERWKGPMTHWMPLPDPPET